MIKRILGIAFFISITLSTMNAQTAIEKVQASFIASFMRYIQWPQQESLKNFNIGILGNNSLIASELQKIVSGKNIGLATVNVKVVNEAEDLKDCQVLFIPKGRIPKAKKELTSLESSPILTVTEEQNYTPDLAVINFKVVNSKLTFQLNNDIASSKKILVSNKLAQMARD